MPRKVQLSEIKLNNLFPELNSPKLVEYVNRGIYLRWRSEGNYIHKRVEGSSIDQALVNVGSAYEEWKSDQLKPNDQYYNKDTWHPKFPTCGVYLITTDSDSIKIGLSKYIPSRMHDLKLAIPQDLKVLLLIPVEEKLVKYAEKELHSKFAYCRRDREWFWNVPSLSKFIDDKQKELEFSEFIFGSKPVW